MPIRPPRADGLFATDPNSRGKANIISPTQPNQIPVSRVNAVNGMLEYTPEDYPFADPAFADPANIGKAVTIVAGASAGATTLGLSDVVEKDDAIDALINQNGLITVPTITVVNSNTIHITAFKAHFNNVIGSNAIIDVPEQDIVITKANSGVATDDVTFLILNQDGTFTQTTTVPTNQELFQLQYIAEINHLDGGAIQIAKIIATVYSNSDKKNRDLFDTIGLNNKGFLFSFTRATGAIAQTGTNARIIGYLISSNPANPDVVSFPVVTAINVRYFSFNPADRLTTLTDFRRTYKVDNPTASTSTAIPNGQFGIIAIYGDVAGKYTVIAPQQVFATEAEAINQRLSYLSNIVLPPLFIRNNVLLASVIVVDTVTSVATTIFNLQLASGLVFNGCGSVNNTSGLPNPATAQAGDVVVVNPTTNGFQIQASKINYVAPAPAGSILVSDGTKFQPTPIQNINLNTLGLFAGMRGLSFVKFIWDTSSNTITTTKIDPDNYFTNCNVLFGSSSSGVNITTINSNIINYINPIIAYLIPITDASTVDNFILSIRTFSTTTINLFGGNLNLQKDGKAYELILFYTKYV